MSDWSHRVVGQQQPQVTHTKARAKSLGGLLTLLLILLVLWIGFAWPYSAIKAEPLAQSFDAAATVTSLVATRDIIHALLTLTAASHAGISTPTPNVTSQAVANATATQVNLPTVTIRVAGLNVRSGPGTSFGAVGKVAAGETYTILAQAANCGWLQIGQNQREIGWISGGSQYVTFAAPCASIPSAN